MQECGRANRFGFGDSELIPVGADRILTAAVRHQP
jgi:hypothetical protein